jgi:hypothetical protein
MSVSSRDGGVGLFIRADMAVTSDHITFPCVARLINKQDKFFESLRRRRSTSQQIRGSLTMLPFDAVYV